MATKIARQQALLVARRERIFATLQRSYDAFKTLQNADAPLYKSRFDKLDVLEADFEAVQTDILTLNSQLEEGVDALPVDATEASFEDVLYATRKLYLAAVAATAPNPTPTPTSDGPRANSLPTIKLPVFSGDIAQWPDFYALFSSLVHDNKTLTNVQRFHYLRSSLKDAALATIGGFPISDENYSLAYKALTSRYQNKRLLASLYIQQVLDFTPLKSSSHAKLQHFLQIHRNCMDALRALAIPNLEDFVLLSLSLSNLDSQTRKSFEAKHTSSSIPTYTQLITYLDDVSRTLELCSMEQAGPASAKPLSNQPSSKKVHSLLVSEPPTPEARQRQHVSSSTRQTSSVCPLCKGAHTLYQCDAFMQASLQDKYAELKRMKRCFNCFGLHMQSACTSRSGCRRCRSTQHHTMLHPDAAAAKPVTPLVINSTSLEEPVVASNLSCRVGTPPSRQRVALLGTFRAVIKDSSGHYQPIRGVIDSGSQVSAITLSLTHKLGLKITPCHTVVSGIGQATTQVYGSTQCAISSRVHRDSHLEVQALVLASISDRLPSTSVPTEVLERYLGLSLADEKFHIPDQIDFLLGADLYPDILSRNGDVVIRGSPSALNTMFGWVVLGSIPFEGTEPPAPLSLFTCSTTTLESSLRHFWEIEEISRPKQEDPEDQLCEDHFVSSHSRDASGRYVVNLPFKPQRPPLGSTRNAAMQCYLGLERRLKRNSSHNDAYQHFMREYEELGHMQPAVTPADYVIPHHCVHKVTSSSTKLRVVFNASHLDSLGTSLNQQLLTGPKLQQELPSILTHFRTHPIAICADIRQMYRQILISPDDRSHQHIFWRPTPDSPVVEYELNTVTYGLVPSAFLAQRVLHQLVDDEGASSPLAAQALRDHTYVDDIVTGVQDLEEALVLQSQLQTLLSRGGFELRKWVSNVPEALSALPADHLETPLVFANEDEGVKILGLLWDARCDAFAFQVQPFNGPLTKRTALSYIARTFDPLGFLSPFIAWMKMFIQQLWLSHLEWDEPLSEELTRKWHSAVADVAQIGEFRVPRHFPALHGVLRAVGFCDASEKGYAAVLYLHATTGSSSHVSLLRAKSKVAPVKTVTIPKLELMAALLLARLLQTTLPSLSTLDVSSVVLYSDSSIVLAWLATQPHTLKTFVANRVVEILDHSSPSDWAHVPSDLNPADCASRGLSATEMIHHPLWQNGPAFLYSPISTWPRSIPTPDITSLPEIKSPTMLIVKNDADADANVDPLLLHFRKFSTLLRAKRVFAYVVRFARLLLAKRSRVSYEKGPLRPTELQCSMDLLVKLTQRHFYEKELRQLTLGTDVVSKLAPLKPFVDDAGFLKVGGRLRHSSLPVEARHPLLLPKQAHLSSLLCDDYHKQALHSGPRTVQALIQQKFWIVSLRGLLRQRIRRCLTCLKFRAKTCQPVMADLPPARVQASRAFSHVGTDYAGPFRVKASNRRNAALSKGYLCIFICMSTKAVHLEMASDLSTDGFLACLDRLLARRGLPSDIYSDNGRNFVGAARQLREISEFLVQANPDIADFLSTRRVRWHFTPPYAPNFGGLWEAGVKSAKTLLHRLIADTPHTHEEFATLFCRIEAVLNSRPLYALASDPEESGSYLSPGHFLVGTTLLAPPEPIETDRASRLSRWQHIRQLHQTFWSRWHSEYLHSQMQRGKWQRSCPNLSIGDVVYFKDSTSSPLSWPIGRVINLLPSRDGVVRVVSIRTTHGTFVRPVNRLVALPLA